VWVCRCGRGRPHIERFAGDHDSFGASCTVRHQLTESTKVLHGDKIIHCPHPSRTSDNMLPKEIEALGFGVGDTGHRVSSDTVSMKDANQGRYRIFASASPFALVETAALLPSANSTVWMNETSIVL